MAEERPGPLLTAEKAATIINASFPNVDAAELRYLGSGTMYDVFLTADGWAFRFPRNDWSGDLFDKEATVHQFVAQIRDVPQHAALDPGANGQGRGDPRIHHGRGQASVVR